MILVIKLSSEILPFFVVFGKWIILRPKMAKDKQKTGLLTDFTL